MIDLSFYCFFYYIYSNFS